MIQPAAPADPNHAERICRCLLQVQWRRGSRAIGTSGLGLSRRQREPGDESGLCYKKAGGPKRWYLIALQLILPV